jgi:hypothetical protein
MAKASVVDLRLEIMHTSSIRAQLTDSVDSDYLPKDRPTKPSLLPGHLAYERGDSLSSETCISMP